jgi:hypothetical protein
MGNITGIISGYWQTQQGQGIILIVILIMVAVLLFGNLSNQNLRQDEVHTAIDECNVVICDGTNR